MSLKAVDIQVLAQNLSSEIGKAIVGKREQIDLAVLAMLCNGHLLLEDIPGVGKTTLAKALSRALGGEFRRMQFTPDLLPADVTGSIVYSPRDGSFEFRPGPVFGNVVLVDEINRATPKTQSALLEAMEERQVTSDGVTHMLPKPFFVIATQNNVEMTGTYPLPEAQLDRFFGRLSLGYPDRDAEAEILAGQQIIHPLELVSQRVEIEEFLNAQAGVRDIFIHDSVRHYIVDVVRQTRDHSLLTMGASPRGSLHLAHAAQGFAAIQGADFVTPDHVKAVSKFVLAHRIIPRGEVKARGMSNEEIVDQVLNAVPVPLPIAR
ncbi:MAG: MoxR family ATPase [Armatimonadetes bacterium]|nr:MoxR family ATPase [Armatimonadota bacterium]